MESVVQTSSKLNSLTSKLKKLTIQNNLEDIKQILIDFEDHSKLSKSSNSKNSRKKYTRNEKINFIVQETIQNQLKGFIDKIENGLKKYWYTDMETKLYTFINDLRDNWEFFKHYLQVDESIDFLEETIISYVQDLKKQRAGIELEELAEAISSSFEYWPTQKAHKCLELADFLNQKEEYEAFLKQTQIDLIKYNLENNLDLQFIKNLDKKFPLLLDKDSNKELFELINNKMKILEKQDLKENLEHQLSILERSIVQGSFWDFDIEIEIIEQFLLADLESLIMAMKKLIQLISLYYKKGSSSSIFDTYPELGQQDQYNTINIEYEGVWSLDIFLKGKWYPAYRLKENSNLINLEFNQKGEWKNRKFKCFTWSLIGSIPVGTILRLKNKKEILHFIVTKDPVTCLRDIDLDQVDENIIANLTLDNNKNAKSNDSKFNIEKISKKYFSRSVENKYFLNSAMIKLSLKFISMDKKLLTLFSQIVKYEYCKKKDTYLSLLNPQIDQKFIKFLSKL